MSRLARRLAPRLLTWTGVRPAYGAAMRALRMPYVVAVNYHWTPPEAADALARQLDELARTHVVLDRAGLAGFFAGTTALARPGLLVTFDDGNRNTYDVAAPLLEARGLRAWFFVIAATLDPSTPGPIEGIHRRFTMGAAELSDLARRGHAVGSHTYSHARLGASSTDALARELVDSRRRIEDATGVEVDAFAYPYGTRDAYSEDAHRVAASTYRYVFTSCPSLVRPHGSPHAIGRHDLAPDMEPHLVRLKTSGLLNLRYAGRARRHRRIRSQATAGAGP